MIPGCESVTVQIVDTAKCNIRYHTKHRNWLCKPANHVTNDMDMQASEEYKGPLFGSKDCLVDTLMLVVIEAH